MLMTQCQFPGCEATFPQHYISRYCGALSHKRDTLVRVVAGQAHEDWRREWRVQNGAKTRVKDTTDASWSAAHGGATTCDIAVTTYDDLPSDWKMENKRSAEVVADAVLAAVQAGRPLDQTFIEEISAAVHAQWVGRNVSWAPEELKRPYGELSEGEKEKDRLWVRRAIDGCRQLD